MPFGWGTKDQDIELPNESGKTDPRLRRGRAPIEVLRESRKLWEPIRTGKAIKGLREALEKSKQ